MNVLSTGKVPKVMSLRDVLLEWLEHRKDVLQRRSRHRLAEIERRLEILGGFLIAYLNIDEVIRIIRYEDEPKAELMRRFELTDMQAEAILNMRLRSLRKLEEIEIRKEFDALTEEKAEIEALLASDEKQWQTDRLADRRGARRNSARTPISAAAAPTFAEAPDHDLEDHPAGDDRERADHRRRLGEGLDPRHEGASGRFRGARLQGGRQAEARLPRRDDRQDPAVLPPAAGSTRSAPTSCPAGAAMASRCASWSTWTTTRTSLTAFVHEPERRLLLVSTVGNGFIVAEGGRLANTRKGKQVMNVTLPDEARLCVPVTGDHVAIVGENRKMLVFPLVQMPEMTRGKGVRLQRYKDGGVSDAAQLRHGQTG